MSATITDVGTIGRKSSSQKDKPRMAYLDGWRARVQPIVNGFLKLTPKLVHEIISESRRYLDDPETPDDERDGVLNTALGLLTRQQGPALLPKIIKESLPQYEMDLLNKVYSVGEATRMKLGSMTPEEVDEWVMPELDEQIAELRKTKAEIRKLMRRCKHRDRPIADQL
jgi:hypothetical protein